jgi:hypothetical protein
LWSGVVGMVWLVGGVASAAVVGVGSSTLCLSKVSLCRELVGCDHTSSVVLEVNHVDR